MKLIIFIDKLVQLYYCCGNIYFHLEISIVKYAHEARLLVYCSVQSQFLLLFFYIYFWLCWVFVSVRGLSLVVASGGHSSSRCAGLSLSRPLLLQSTGSRRAGSVIVAHGPSCSAACGIFPDQGSNLCPVHWQADSQPLRHQGSPTFILKALGFALNFMDLSSEICRSGQIVYIYIWQILTQFSIDVILYFINDKSSVQRRKNSGLGLPFPLLSHVMLVSSLSLGLFPHPKIMASEQMSYQLHCQLSVPFIFVNRDPSHFLHQTSSNKFEIIKY